MAAGPCDPVVESWIPAPVFLVLSLVVLYWIIRLGVRHGIRDAERHRSDGR